MRQLAELLTQWLRTDLPLLEKAEPDMPVEDRAADTWEPLVAVADHAGAHWPDRARAAVLVLTTEAADNGDVSTRVRLLIDCRAAFCDHDAIPTAVLLERLRRDPEAPWGDYGPTGLTAMKLGRLLREYDIHSTNIRFPGLGQARATTALTSPTPGPATARQPPMGHPSRGKPSQPSQPHHRRSARDGWKSWDG